MFVVEAIPPQVKLTKLEDFLIKYPSDTEYYHGTFIDIDTKNICIEAAQLVAIKQLGKPYSLNYEPPPNKFYCSSTLNLLLIKLLIKKICLLKRILKLFLSRGISGINIIKIWD